MAYQYSVAVRNAKLDAVETTVGTSPVLKIFSGALPANCAASDPAGLLCTISLPSDYLGNAGAGVKSLSGVWSGTASAGGTIASWRIYDSGVTTCHIQGDTTAMTFTPSTSVSNGQTVTVNTFTITAGNA